MGNSLNVDKVDGANSFGNVKSDASMLDKYITDYFKNYQDDYFEKNFSNLKSVYNPIKEMSKNPFKTRACCTKSNYIPIALPYVGPDKTKHKKILTAFPLVKILDFEIEKSDGNNTAEYTSACKIPKTNNTSEINLTIGSAEADVFQQFTSGKSSCERFYYEKPDSDGKSISLCDRVIDTRKIKYPDSKLTQYYGDVSRDHDNQIDKDGDYFKIKGKYFSAYPDCNCANSVAQREPQPQIEMDEHRQSLVQLQDKYCGNRNAIKKYVDVINQRSIDLCINIAEDIKATALSGSTIEINQTCAADTTTESKGGIDQGPSSDPNDGDNMDEEDDDDDITETPSATATPATAATAATPATPATPATTPAATPVATPEAPAATKITKKKKKLPIALIAGVVGLLFVLLLVLLLTGGSSEKAPNSKTSIKYFLNKIYKK